MLSGIDVGPLCLGAMMFGTTTPEDTAFALLDRFVEAGGRFIDTANCYQFWAGDGQGHESEELLGRWLAARGMAGGPGRDRIVIATKVGARPEPGPGRGDFPDNREGLSAKTIETQLETSLRRMGLDYVDLFYSHHEDRSTPLTETVEAMAATVTSGKVRALGVSNEPSWRIERARRIAAADGLPTYTCIQQRFTYLHQAPGRYDAFMPIVDDGMLDYVNTDEDLTLIAYSPLLAGAYSGRSDRPVPEIYDHPGSASRLEELGKVAAELGATANQVVLAWLMAGDPTSGRPPILPLFSAGSLEQLEDSLGSLQVSLDDELITRLNAAG